MKKAYSWFLPHVSTFKKSLNNFKLTPKWIVPKRTIKDLN